MECCPDSPGTVSGMARNRQVKEWSDAGLAVRVSVRFNDSTGSRKRTPMARKTLSMRQIHEILRLKYQNGLSIREIAASCGLPTSTVGDYLQRAEIAGIGWPAPEGLSEQQLIEMLMAAPPLPREPYQFLPDWPHIHAELRRKSVTLQLLWQEYRAVHPQGYGY